VRAKTNFLKVRAGTANRYLLPVPPAPQTIDRYLAQLGYGTRRTVAALFADGWVRDDTGRRVPPNLPLPSEPGARAEVLGSVRVNGEPLDPPPGSVIALHKPTGYVSSTRDTLPVVYALLPERFTRRRPLMAPVGRLDRDTSGILLLTDDGRLLHRLTSPRWHVPKTYLVSVHDPLRGDESQPLTSGTLLLRGEDTPLLPADYEAVDTYRARVTITEGRYHQVRRMFAAVGHHVTALHRLAVGTIALGDLPEGAWRVLTNAERASLGPQSP
jgi:16S rRNA pseudouridine516 synthase